MQTLKDKYNQLLNSTTQTKKAAWGAKTTIAQDNNFSSEIVNLILSEAVLSRASDIHIEPQKKFYPYPIPCRRKVI